MKFTISTAILSLLAAMPVVQAHIEMISPAPIQSKHNKFSKNIDYSYTSPMTSKLDYPCKGVLKKATADEKTPVATWPAGSTQTMVLSSGAVHAGGSCQASISEDDGATWKAIATFNGGCPLKTNWPVQVPKDTKTGTVLFAWTWFNKEGNREMYMNCAAVKITGGGKGLSSLKDIVVGNSANPACTFPEGTDPDLNKGCPGGGAPATGAKTPTGGNTGTPANTPTTPKTSTTPKTDTTTPKTDTTTPKTTTPKTDTTTPKTDTTTPKTGGNATPATNGNTPGKTQWYDPSTNPGIPKNNQRRRRAVRFRA